MTRAGAVLLAALLLLDPLGTLARALPARRGGPPTRLPPARTRLSASTVAPPLAAPAPAVVRVEIGPAETAEAAREIEAAPEAARPALEDAAPRVAEAAGEREASGAWSAMAEVFDRAKRAAGAGAEVLAGMSAAGTGEDEPKKKAAPLHRLPLEEQLSALMDKYKVPAADRARRRRLTMDAVDRIRVVIPLMAGRPDLQVEFGPWWLTVQDLGNPRLKRILIPIEDIFVRAVDEDGVQEAIGASVHEIAHYSITRGDMAWPETAKYMLKSSPKPNNLLYQVIEDTRINTWSLVQRPGYRAYFDAIYEALWPEDPDKAKALEDERKSLLARSTVRVTTAGGQKKGWMPPHIQYANAIIYYWRHRKAPPFLTDPMAVEAFEKTKDALDRIRNIHPEAIGGVLTEPMKQKASRDMMTAVDKEIYPFYEELIEKSKQDLQEMLENGEISEEDLEDEEEQEDGDGDQDGEGKPGKSGKTGKNSGKKDERSGGGRGEEDRDEDGDRHGESGGTGSQGGEDGTKGGKPGTGKASGRSTDDILDDMAKDLAEAYGNHGRDERDEARANGWRPEGEEEPGVGSPGEAGESPAAAKDKSFLERRKDAMERAAALKGSFTDYERYRQRAMELGLINKVDGVVKKILLPTKHSRLSRGVYHDGDEVDMNKYYDDAAQGRFDTPVMRRWNRKIRRSANISLALDISGSMGDMTEEMNSPLDYSLIGLVAWIEVCQKNGIDFEMLIFDDGQEVLHPFGAAVNREAKQAIIAQVAAARRGSTAIGDAFKFALDRLIPRAATHRFVVFATDEGHNSGVAPEAWTELARKNRIVTFAMVIADEVEGFKKSFDYAVRVRDPKDFPNQLLEVLKKAVKAILGPGAMWMAFGEPALRPLRERAGPVPPAAP